MYMITYKNDNYLSASKYMHKVEKIKKITHPRKGTSRLGKHLYFPYPTGFSQTVKGRMYGVTMCSFIPNYYTLSGDRVYIWSSTHYSTDSINRGYLTSSV